MPGPLWTLLPFALIGLAALTAAVLWARRRAAARYDLRRLGDAPRTGWYDQSPLGPGEEPDEALVNEDSGPYCLSCGVGYPAGTSSCRQCGRRL